MNTPCTPKSTAPIARPIAPDGALAARNGVTQFADANVYQMIMGTSGPVFVRRNTWATGLAEVVGAEPSPHEWPQDRAPYFENPVVFALLKYGLGMPYVLVALSSPGTYGYRRVNTAPEWWRRGLRYPVIGRHKGRKLELSELGLHVV